MVQAKRKDSVVPLQRNDLANTFRRLAIDGKKVEDTANHIFQIVAASDVRKLAEFDEKVREAYRGNGWKTGAGRPAAGAGATDAVPAIVKTYVSEVRAAFRLGLKVHSFSTFYALRQAIKKKRARLLKQRQPSWPALEGVRIASPYAMTGAVFHDVVVVYEHLDDKAGAALEQALHKLVEKYLPNTDGIEVQEIEEWGEAEKASA